MSVYIHLLFCYNAIKRLSKRQRQGVVYHRKYKIYKFKNNAKNYCLKADINNIISLVETIERK